MIKKIFLYLKEKEVKITTSVFTKEGFEISYTPVYIVSIESDLNSFKEAIFGSLDKSNLTVDIGDFPTDKNDYNSFVFLMMKELKEKSFDNLQKKSKEFIVELDEASSFLIISPLIYNKSGSYLDEEHIIKLDIKNMSKNDIAHEVKKTILKSNVF